LAEERIKVDTSNKIKNTLGSSLITSARKNLELLCNQLVDIGCNIIKNKNSYITGIKGEEIAEKYLISLGYSIVKKRYKTRYGEIDIVAAKDKSKKLLLFVEIKHFAKKTLTLRNNEVISPIQIRRNCNAALYFITNHNEYKDYQCRFDLIIISEERIENHIKNAWDFLEDLASW
jgi:putative endonuclease